MKTLLTIGLCSLWAVPSAAAPADGGSAPADGGVSSTTSSVRVAGTNYFDVGTCWATPPVLSTATKEGLTATLVDVEPQIKECLASPSRRGSSDLTRVTVETQLGEAGPQTEISGDNLTAAGVACARTAATNWLRQIAAFNAKGATATARVVVVHNRKVDPAVELEVNPQSDAIASIRLAEHGWCECFASWKGVAPRPLQGKVSIAQARSAGPTAPTSVTFAPTGDPASEQVIGCLQTKIAGLTFPGSTTASYELPLTLKYVESGFGGDLGEDLPDLQFVQLDLQRGHANAAASVALGARDSIFSDYAALVAKYQSKKQRRHVKIQDLIDSCQWLLNADDGVSKALLQVLELERRAHAFATTQAARNPAWAEAEAAAAKQEASAAGLVERAQKSRSDDEAACPKVH